MRIYSGVKKFIIHSRKCLLSGLTPKQNREIPPLQYDVVHRLISEFPELTFILNGGIRTLQQADEHLNGSFLGLPPVHGVMIGRAAYANPYILAGVDSRYFGEKDLEFTRREVMDRYLSHCDRIQSDDGPTKNYRGKTNSTKPAFLLRAVQNAFVGCQGCSKYRTTLNDAYVRRRREGGLVIAREVVISCRETHIF